MRIAVIGGRTLLSTRDGWIDVQNASAGRFPADPHGAYDAWSEFRSWTFTMGATESGDTVRPYPSGPVGSPVPRPCQVFAIGLNSA
uniref:Putative fumarylacetoacetate hydrolase,N-terminal part n=1 Tax=Rhodococcus sp. PY11 TaxID=551544 RepID=B5MAE1_9NOCA|nr:putative fumarylacetoacetate hydrolase,N-terminal part [Rhodococcus sp. PY11]